MHKYIKNCWKVCIHRKNEMQKFVQYLYASFFVYNYDFVLFVHSPLAKHLLWGLGCF